jgi:hypothetical protein
MARALEAQIVGTRGRLEGDPQLRGHFGRIPFRVRAAHGATTDPRYLRPRYFPKRIIVEGVEPPTMFLFAGWAAPRARVAVRWDLDFEAARSLGISIVRGAFPPSAFVDPAEPLCFAKVGVGVPRLRAVSQYATACVAPLVAPVGPFVVDPSSAMPLKRSDAEDWRTDWRRGWRKR